MFELVKILGGMTVAEFLARVSSVELTEWRAEFNIEAEERRRFELEARARQGVAARKQSRRGRR